MISILFFGGWQAPLPPPFHLHASGTPLSFISFFWLFAKIIFFFFIFAMIKAIVPRMQMAVCDRAIQSFGAMGLSSDTPLASLWTGARVLRIADGPDEVHLRAVAKQEMAAASERRGSTLPFLVPNSLH